MRVPVIGLLLAACGRMYFDPIDDGGLPASACLPTPEVCNGIDDDCDGAIDPGCPCTPFLAMTSGSSIGYRTDIAWTGNAYYVVRFDGAGPWRILNILDTGAVGAELPLQFLSIPRILWTGDRLIVILRSAGEVHAYKLTTTGTIESDVLVGQGTDIWVSRAGRDIDVAWTEMGAVERRFHVQRLDHDLNLLGPRHTLVVPSSAISTGIATSRTVAFAALVGSTATAITLGTPSPIVEAQASRIEVSGNGTGFMVSTPAPSDTLALVHGDPDGKRDAGPFVLSLGFSALSSHAAFARGEHYVIVATGAIGTDGVAQRYDVDANGVVQSQAEMFRVTLPSVGTLGVASAYADAGRTAVWWGYFDGTTSTEFLAQTCP